jgi:two-component system cell cycle response regulator
MGAGIVFHALHALFGLGHPALDGFTEDGIYTAVEVVAVGICAARALRRPQDRVAWLLITGGLLTWAAGDFVWSIWLSELARPPYPSIADPLYLAMYPAIYAALLLLMRSQFRHVGLAVWLDGLVVGLATAAAGAALVFPAVVSASGGSAAAVIVNLAYPLCDFLLLVFIALGFALSGWRPGRQWLLLGIGIAISAVADMIFAYQEAHAAYVGGGILDTMWPASMAVMALAAWQPASRAVQRAVVGRHTVILPAIFGALALALLASASVRPLTPLAVGLATGALLATGARASLTYLENVRMLKRQTLDAITDSLTGLPNRRGLMEDLDIAAQGGLRGRSSTLVFFDLNGFKRYNDSFGHGAGDDLLTRLGAALAQSVDGYGTAYRLGGDEFCVLLDGRFPPGDALVARAHAALAEHGSGFRITAACGAVVLPEEADTVTSALSLADERMYAQKSAGRASDSQTQSVLLQLLTEPEPTLHEFLAATGRATPTGRVRSGRRSSPRVTPTLR